MTTRDGSVERLLARLNLTDDDDDAYEDYDGEVSGGERRGPLGKTDDDVIMMMGGYPAVDCEERTTADSSSPTGLHPERNRTNTGRMNDHDISGGSGGKGANPTLPNYLKMEQNFLDI